MQDDNIPWTNLLITYILSIQANRWLHCKKGQNLKQMVLHYVTDDAIVVKVPEISHLARQISLHTEPRNQ